MTSDREARIAELTAALSRTTAPPPPAGAPPDHDLEASVTRPDGQDAETGTATPATRAAPAVDGPPVVETRNLVREFEMGGTVVRAVDDVSIRIEPGQLVAVRGRSGSGKTTLLSLIGALDRPTLGSVHVTGLAVSEAPERDLVPFRRRTIGFIFQAFGLLPILSAAENVEIPLRLVNADRREREARVAHLLEIVGLAGRANHRPHELSGGEQQRVAIARALANHPRLLLADEPTGQLDSHTGRDIMALIRSMVRSEDATAIVATHDPALIELADTVIELRDGKVIAEG
jgi:putative ABC transport system ATP-binding protein